MIGRLLSAIRSPRGRIGIILSSANYLQAAVGFGVNFYLANALGASGFGLLSYGIVLGTFLYTVVNFGAERTLVRDLVQREDQERVVTASLTLRAILAAIVLTGTGLWLLVAPPAREKSLVVFFCTVAACFWAANPVAWFDAHYRMHVHAVITLLERAVYAAAVVVVLGRGTTDGVVTVALLLLATRAGSCLIQLAVARRSLRFDRTDLRRNLRWLLRGNVLIVAAALANLLISHWNQLSLEHRLSSARLGYYALAFQMIAVVTLLQNQILRLFFPRIAALTADGADPHLAGRKLTLYMIFGTVVSAAAVLPMVLLAPWIINSFFDAEYLRALPVVQVLSLWVVFNGGARIVNAFLINLRLDQTFFWSAIAAGLVAVLLGYVLIPRQGEVGVALALLISHPISVTAQFVRVKRELRRRKAAWQPATAAGEE